MDKHIINHLQTFKNVTPDSDFAANTRRLVLAIHPSPYRLPLWVWGISFAAVLLAIISSGLLITSPPVISSSLDSELLRQEFNELDINIHLKEVTYQQDINQTISSALTEISNVQISHLNPSILKSEEERIRELEEESEASEIDALLDKVIF